MAVLWGIQVAAAVVYSCPRVVKEEGLAENA